MDIDLHKLLKSTKLFASLDDAGINNLAGRLREIQLKKNNYLFRQGELSDGIFILVHGKLLAFLKTRFNEKKIISEIHSGETVGEIGALSHEPRGASLKALEDSFLFKLTRTDFVELCQHYPAMLLQIVNILTTRSHSLLNLLSAREPAKKHIAIVPANKKVSLAELTSCLAKNLKNFPEVKLLSDYDDELTAKYKTKAQWSDYIDTLKGNNIKIIYILKLHSTLLSKAAFDNLDVLYIAGTGHSKAYLNPTIHKMLRNKELTYKAKPELILLYEKESKIPSGTVKWLKLADFGMHHHIRLCRQGDLERLLRFITSQAVGVVLGGGGARSWAHIGALKALHEKGIPIDIICGTSGGAIVGGYYALNETFEDLHNDLNAMTRVTNLAVGFRRLTWPAVSIFDGKDFTREQQSIFGKHKIENLWLPFFCVSCNLTKSVAVTHRRGALWKKVRASTAVPGIFPPVVINGQLHLDGGIVNNLPVDLLKQLTSNVSLTIAVELIHMKQKDKDYNFPPILPLGKVLLAKMKLGYKKYKFPSFVDTFLKSLMAGSSAKQNENAQAADILISPSLSGFDLLRVSAKQQNELMEIGYKATIEALSKPHKKVKKTRVKTGVHVKKLVKSLELKKKSRI